MKSRISTPSWPPNGNTATAFALLLSLFMCRSGALVPSAQAQTATEAPYLAVGKARTKRTVIAFPALRAYGKTPEAATLATQMAQTTTNDLSFLDLFNFLQPAAFIENSITAGITPETFKFTDWSSIGAELLVKGGLTVEGKTLTLEAFLYDVSRAKSVLGKRYVADIKDASTVAHTLANDIAQTLTGMPGIFLTKIAMSCDVSGKKEIYIMNIDGSDIKQITNHRSIAFAPAWSPDGTKIAYSLYTRHRGNIKNIDLYEFDFVSNTVRLLSNKSGINSGAAYSPDGRKVALTMSFLGNPEIFYLDLRERTATRVTHSPGFDVDPSWSKDGTKLAFVSSRTGKPMVFSMNQDGGGTQRLTYAGRFNATPSWSPQNNKVAFAGWLEDHFDVFIMNPDGTNIERLTKGQGNNEDPHFSPDGNFIVFSSNRTGKKNIYVMNIDGSFVKRLTYGLGNCVSPKWSAQSQTK